MLNKSVQVSENMNELINILVDLKYFPSKSELIRVAIRDFLRDKILDLEKNFKNNNEKSNKDKSELENLVKDILVEYDDKRMQILLKKIINILKK